jgi:hypothetical protein
LLNCIYLIASSFDECFGIDSKVKGFNEKLEQEESLSRKSTIDLVPISRTYKNMEERPFPYFERTLISWIEKHRTVSTRKRTKLEEYLCTP